MNMMKNPVHPGEILRESLEVAPPVRTVPTR